MDAKYNADLISIGQYLHTIYNDKATDNDVYRETGERFCMKYVSGCTPRQILKDLRFDKLGVEVLVSVLSDLQDAVSNHIKIREEDAQCTVTVVNTEDLTKLGGKPFFYSDIQAYAHRYVVIDSLESRSPGAGFKLLNYLLDTCKYVPVILQAGYLYYGEYELCSDDSFAHVPEQLADKYAKVGFRNINNYVGGYEDSIVMIKCTDMIYGMITGKTDPWKEYVVRYNVQDETAELEKFKAMYGTDDMTYLRKCIKEDFL